MSGYATERRLKMSDVKNIVILSGIVSGIAISTTILGIGVFAQNKRLKTLVKAILFFAGITSILSCPFWIYNWVGVVQIDANPFIEYPALVGPYFSITATFASIVAGIIICVVAEEIEARGVLDRAERDKGEADALR